MVKKHGGSGKPQGVLNRGTQPRPNPYHAGSGRPLGVVHAPSPRVYGLHGGTNLRQGVLNKKRK
jgi:hypothetical protein